MRYLINKTEQYEVNTSCGCQSKTKMSLQSQQNPVKRPLVGLMTHTPFKNINITLVPPFVQRQFMQYLKNPIDPEKIPTEQRKAFRRYGLVPLKAKPQPPTSQQW
jgi:hypothetical protein